MKNRQIIGYAIAISMIIINPILIFFSFPIIIITTIDYLLTKPKNKEIEKEVPIEEENNIEEIRALVEKIQEKNEEEKEYRKNVDIRQFKGRKDVTKEEVEKYLWTHYIWEGIENKKIILEEICKTSNLDKENIKEIIKEHIKKGGCWIRNEELRREKEYTRKKAYEEDLKKKKELEISDEWIRKIDKKVYKINMKNKLPENEEFMYIFNYEEWLKMKGYV